MDKDAAYRILSELIFKGFLCSGVTLENNFFVFKTINEKEYELIKYSCGNPDDKNYVNRFNIYFLIYSLFMLNGKNILLTRNNDIESLYEFFKELPKTIHSNILKHIVDLRNDTFDATKYLEGFSYTDTSRAHWKTAKGLIASPDLYTGIPGISNLGLNIHQENWSIINKALDEEERYNQFFSMALLVASASNPKGTKQIRSRHDSQLKNVEDRRKRLAEAGYIDVKAWRPEGWAAPVDSAEELVAELERQMEGKKDKHDVFMENYMKKLRENAQARVKEAKEHIERAKALHGDDNVFITGEHRVATPEELSKAAVKKSTLVKVHGEESSAEDKDRFIKKVGGRVLTARK